MKKDNDKKMSDDTKLSFFYGIIFVIILVAALIFRLTSRIGENNKDGQNNEKEKTVIVDYETQLNNVSNYEEDIIINKYYFNEYINIKRQEDNELISIKTHDLNVTYHPDEKVSEEVLRYSDMTFVKPENILKLLNVKSYNQSNKYMVETSNWVPLYNELNNTNLEKIISGEISIEFVSCSSDACILTMDLTNLYKNLNYDYESVIYNIKIYNINGIDLTNID